MAAVGILAALHERERSGEEPGGRRLDDGRRPVVARDGCGALLRGAEGAAARRARAGRRDRVLLPVHETKDERWVSLGALEPKFWQNWCNGAGRPDLIEKQFEHPDSEAGAEIAAVFRERTRDEWTAFAGEHDCCLEPILDLDEVLDSELVRARGMVVELDQPGIGPVKQVGAPIKLSRRRPTPRAPRRRWAPTPMTCCARSVSTRNRCARTAWCERRVGQRVAADAGAGEAAGVSAGTIKHSARASSTNRSRHRATWRGTRPSSSSGYG